MVRLLHWGVGRGKAREWSDWLGAGSGPGAARREQRDTRRVPADVCVINRGKQLKEERGHVSWLASPPPPPPLKDFYGA